MGKAADAFQRIRNRFQRRIRTSFLVRFHMAIILLGTAVSGVLYSKLLLELHLRWMAIRFPVAVLLSYLTFFLFVKLWLGYIARAAKVSAATADGAQFLDSVLNPGGGGGAGAAPDPGPLSFGGGGSGGGGAGGSFAAIAGAAEPADAVPFPVPGPAVAVAESSVAAPSGASEAAGEGASALLDFDGAAVVLAVLALAAGVVAITGGYLIYDAPNILPDAAWEAALGAGLFRGLRRVTAPDWAGSILRSTWKPFACILALGFLVGYIGGTLYPDARSVVDLWRAAHAPH